MIKVVSISKKWFQKLKYRVPTYFDILKNNLLKIILTKYPFCVYFRIQADFYTH